MTINFEQWLMEYYANENPEVCDDDLIDYFNEWVTDLDPDDWIRLGQKYAEIVAKKLKEETT